VGTTVNWEERKGLRDVTKSVYGSMEASAREALGVALVGGLKRREI